MTTLATLCGRLGAGSLYVGDAEPVQSWYQDFTQIAVR
jgi:hypothetical protein